MSALRITIMAFPQAEKPAVHFFFAAAQNGAGESR
jgi:hypothetical protein